MLMIAAGTVSYDSTFQKCFRSYNKVSMELSEKKKVLYQRLNEHLLKAFLERVVNQL